MRFQFLNCVRDVLEAHRPNKHLNTISWNLCLDEKLVLFFNLEIFLANGALHFYSSHS